MPDSLTHGVELAASGRHPEEGDVVDQKATLGVTDSIGDRCGEDVREPLVDVYEETFPGMDVAASEGKLRERVELLVTVEGVQ